MIAAIALRLFGTKPSLFGKNLYAVGGNPEAAVNGVSMFSKPCSVPLSWPVFVRFWLWLGVHAWLALARRIWTGLGHGCSLRPA